MHSWSLEIPLFFLSFLPLPLFLGSLRDMNVQSVSVKMFIKMENLMVDKDIYVKDVVATLMSSLRRLSQVLI